jgi:hydroxyethylthiazole kinase-like uncharacterized protein yjeF
LHGTQASRSAEQTSTATLPPHTLMTRAGEAVARLALAIAPHAQHVWIAAGPGNNGGDGLQAAPLLRAAGKQVLVSLLGDAQRLPADAANALRLAREAGVPIVGDPAPAFKADLAIDALLGLGSRREPESLLAEAVRRLNRGPAPVLAVDLPSGLDAERGARFSQVAVMADHTLSLLTLKPGLFTGEGRDLAGTVWFDSLGVNAGAAEAWLTGATLAASLDPLRRHAQHKGSFGDVVVVGGASGMTGAAWLAARAALAAGAGRVYVDPLDGGGSPAALELMCRPGLSRTQPDALARATVVCGCGGGSAVAGVLPSVLEHSARLVIDADALNAIAADASLQARLAARCTDNKPSLITPHPLEAARLLGIDAASVQHDRLDAAQRLAERLRCAVLLKGSGSVCAAPGEPPYINPTGNALLATAGTGDVLAGWAGGRWAQTLGDGSLRHAQRIGAASAWWHGRAADLAAEAGRRTPLTASLLIDAMAELRPVG